MHTPEILTTIIPASAFGQRLDQTLAEIFSEYSRSRIKTWILNGQVRVDGKLIKAKDKLKGGEKIEMEIRLTEETAPVAEDITLDIVYEDSDLIVINKPVGLVVHPGSGNPGGTLMNALLHHQPQLTTVPRAGIVHRLDKDTSGLMVVAQSLIAHTNLVRQLQARDVHREYQAIAVGNIISGGIVNEPIGRHPTHRTKMAVIANGKEAITHYHVKQRFVAHTHLRLQLETGRTHQIRVHMAHLRHPLVGDPVYGGRLKLPSGAHETLIRTLKNFKRQALHASGLSLVHPATGELMNWQADLPTDMQQLLIALQQNENHENAH